MCIIAKQSKAALCFHIQAKNRAVKAESCSLEAHAVAIYFEQKELTNIFFFFLI